MPSLYTICHSDRSQSQLIDLLQQHDITTLVDIRSHPHSKHHPQLDQDELRHGLTINNIVYHWAGRQLGGLRQGNADSIHRTIETGLRSFADYMSTLEFECAASQLQNLSGKGVAVILCAEKNPEHCQRSLIADYLLLNGMEVAHIIDENLVHNHNLRPEARRESATLVYDQSV